jgi:hypothetical protein
MGFVSPVFRGPVFGAGFNSRPANGGLLGYFVSIATMTITFAFVAAIVIGAI